MKLDKSQRSGILIASCFLNVVYFLLNEEETVCLDRGGLGLFQNHLSEFAVVFFFLCGVFYLRNN